MKNNKKELLKLTEMQKKDVHLFREYPQVVRLSKKKLNYKYLISGALLHLRKHYTPKELAIIFRRSKKFIYLKLKELRQ